jgi:hypothetical protein
MTQNNISVGAGSSFGPKIWHLVIKAKGLRTFLQRIFWGKIPQIHHILSQKKREVETIILRL